MLIAKRKPFLLFSPFMGGRRPHFAPDGAEASIELAVAINISPLARLDHPRSEERRVGKECRL